MRRRPERRDARSRGLKLAPRGRSSHFCARAILRDQKTHREKRVYAFAVQTNERSVKHFIGRANDAETLFR